MNDRELLEAAAKAEGRTLKYMTQLIKGREPEEFIACWNPLTNDGDALRLAVKLALTINPYRQGVFVSRNEGEPVIAEAWRNNKYEDTRRAIVRAAAEVGKNLP